jgi:hydroxypyruvate isomerase
VNVGDEKPNFGIKCWNAFASCGCLLLVGQSNIESRRERGQVVPKFAANLTMLFNEFDFLDRFDAAARAGFKAVEFLFPYAFDKRKIKERLDANGLQLVLHNLPAGDWTGGERGIACLPDRVEEFRSGIARALEYASALGCPRLNCLSGITPNNVDSEIVSQTFIDNLRFAARLLEQSGILLLIEPINTVDIPNFYLSGTQQAVDIIRKVASENLKIQYDIYHMQIMEGNLASKIKQNLGAIGHIQIADNPGRNEPGTGEINFTFLFDFLDSIGYQSWIGCEYRPKDDTVNGLKWLRFKG